MSHQSEFQVVFGAALENYARQTGVTLAEHPLVQQLRNCTSVESIIYILREREEAFSELIGSRNKVMGLIENIVSVLVRISKLGLVSSQLSPVTSISTALNTLFSGAQDGDALVDILQSMEAFLNRLDVYTEIPLTDAMREVIIKILTELFSILALATKIMKQGKYKKFAKKLWGGNEMEAAFQTLYRLTQDESRITAAQTLKDLHSLLQKMRVFMDDSSLSFDRIQERLEIMQQVTSDFSNSRRYQLMKNIQGWLSPADSWENYHLARESRHSGTSEWFIKGTFSEWKNSNSGPLLWVHGKPGAGKGVLCSAIIQYIEDLRKTGLASLAFFYFDSREGYKDRRGLLSSLLFQLCRQSDAYRNILSNFYATHSDGVQDPRDDSLVGCLMELLSVPMQVPVFLILDGLDQCSTTGFPTPREEVLTLLKELIDSEFPHLYLCVTSRPETDIGSSLAPLASHSISLHDESGHKNDIDNYINSFVDTDETIRGWSAKDKEWVSKALSGQADGSFGWVHSNLDYIRQFSGPTQDLLANLSVTLTPNEMYHRTLGDINEEDRELAHYVFQCVAVAFRPLHVEEVAEFFAFNFTDRQIPTYHEGRRRKVDAIPSIYTSLLSTDDSSMVQFLHPSVQKYLASPHRSEPSDTTSLPNNFMTPAHTHAALVCLGILLHLGDNITRDGLLKFPLAEYAAEHWFDHARIENVQQDVEEGLRRLFNPYKSHFAVWIWIHDPMAPSWRRAERAERPSPPSGTPLHYAARYGFLSIVKYLIDKHSQNVRLGGFDDESTPLHVASSQGHEKVARVLLDHGADATAQDKYGLTPLHKAAFAGSEEVAHVLLDHGAKATARDKLGSTPLHQACRNGRVQVAHILLKHRADATARDKHGWTPLHEASSRGHTELVFTLRDHDANVRVQDRHGWTPYRGASSGKHHELARRLLKLGADATSEDKTLSLHDASVQGHVGFARMLLEHGEDATAQDKYGSTPLHKASEGGHAEVVLLLLEHRADATAQDNLGITPLHQASRAGHVEVTGILLKNGADAAAQDRLSWTPLHHSCASGHEEVTRILLDHGVAVTIQDKLGRTPLHGASFGGHKKVCRLLLEKGAQATAQDKQGSTPLHLASGNEHPEVAGILLENGASVKHQDQLGWTPLHKALSVGNVEVARVLLRHDVDREARDKDGRTPLDCASPTILSEELARLFPESSTSLQGAGHRCCTVQ